jgi:hypothetical protein
MQGRELIYKASFNTKVNQTETYCFHFSDFKASFRGAIIDNAPQLEAENISNVGFLIALKQKKMFLLSVESIEFYMCK